MCILRGITLFHNEKNNLTALCWVEPSTWTPVVPFYIKPRDYRLSRNNEGDELEEVIKCLNKETGQITYHPSDHPSIYSNINGKWYSIVQKWQILTIVESGLRERFEYFYFRNENMKGKIQNSVRLQLTPQKYKGF